MYSVFMYSCPWLTACFCVANMFLGLLFTMQFVGMFVYLVFDSIFVIV